MNGQDLKLWNNITFKTQGYRRNFDLVNTDEKYITEYEGTIAELRMEERKPPRPVGEYRFSVWNINLGERFDVDFDELVKRHSADDLYNELIDVIRKYEFSIRKYKKIVLVHSFVLNKNYRKKGVTEEFIEMLYNDFYCDDTAIVVLVKPFQDDDVSMEYFKYKKVLVRETLNGIDVVGVPAMKYYSLDELLKNEDTEINEYKLFAVANRCGFQRINESHLFLFSPEKIDGRMREKQILSQHIENQ